MAAAEPGRYPKTSMRYCVKAKDIYPWGDYGSILAHGIMDSDNSGALRLQRTGPFVPKFSFPSFRIVVDESVKLAIEALSLTGCVFTPIVKAKIVAVDWHLWNLKAKSPQVLPREGEPENYVLARPHSRELADKMPALWELAGTPFGTVTRASGTVNWTGQCEPDLDFIRPNDLYWKELVLSERARHAIEPIHGGTIELVEFLDLEITQEMG